MNLLARFGGGVLVTVLLLGVLVAGVLILATTAPAAPPDDVSEVVAGNTQFALDLYQQLAGGSQENLFMSPYSVSTALGMTYAGARGDTATQMAQTLNITLPSDRFHPAMGVIIDQINDPARDTYTLKSVNRLWGQEGYPFLPEFLGTLDAHYGAGLGELDFRTQPGDSRDTINDWVAAQTNDKIQDLLPPGSVTVDTRLVLTNAIYFLADWEQPFDRELTVDAPFHVTPQESLTIPMMRQESYFNYGEVDGVQVLELPYLDGELSFIALLPEQTDGLAALEAGLTADSLDAYMSSLSPTNMDVSLPKFEMTSKFSLCTTLSDLGMTDAFNPYAADFSGINGGYDLFITEVAHKAFIQMDEEGTEAAAATGVVGGVTSIPPPPVEFLADHPFCFFIRDNLTESILFLGRVIEPEASSFVPASASLPGDLDGDGLVNSDDLDIVRSHWGETVTAGDLAAGDASGDGIVDSGDLDIIRAHWGTQATAAVPEPGMTACLLVLAAWACRRRRG